MSKLPRLPERDRLPFICGAVLLLATLAMAQHALDANLRVGSGGYNAHRRPQVTMSRSPYAVSTQGNIVYDRGAAFGSPEVYNRQTRGHIRRGSPQPSVTSVKGRSRPAPRGALAMQRSPYSANRSPVNRSSGRSVSALSASSRVQTVRQRPGQSRPSMQRTGYWAGNAASQMQTPTLKLQRQTYKPTGSH